MEIEIVQRRQDGVKVIIECAEKNRDIEQLKQYIEKYDVRMKGYKDGTMTLVDIRDVYYFETVDERTFLYTADDCLEIRYRMYELEELFAEKDFVRTSKSQIIHIRKMKSLTPQINRTIMVEMDNGEFLYISRKYVKDFKQKLGLV